MARQDFLILRQDIELKVSQFQLNEARKVFKDMNFDDIPRRERAGLASLARRVGMINESLQILQNQIYGTEKPNDLEMIEYASSLRKLGLVNQALELLSRVESHSQSFLHQAFCFINQWDYQRASQKLERFLQADDIEESKRLVGRLNLLICYLEMEEFEKLEPELLKFKDEVKESNKHLFLNSLESLGQMYIRKGEVEKGMSYLKEALANIQDQRGLAQLFTSKWFALGSCILGQIDHSSEKILDYKKLARQEGHWESLRDFDFYLAQIFSDSNLLNHVFFGTPMKAYRTRFEKLSLPSEFILTRGGSEMKHIVDPYNFIKLGLPAGLNLHRFIMLLLSDFYRPWTVGRIFNTFFKNELYEPISSPKRIYRMIEKLREHIESEKLPIELHTTVAGYRLRPKENAAITIYPNMQFDSQEGFLFELIKKQGITESFKGSQLNKVIPLGAHKWQRALKRLEDKGLIAKDPNNIQKWKLKVS